MQRRALLATLATGSVFAGCLTGQSATEDRTDSDPDHDRQSPERDQETATPRGTSTEPISARGSPETICQQSVVDVGIYAVTDPQFGSDWSSVEVELPYRFDIDDPGLFDAQAVIGLEAGDRARAYPLTVLSTHEIVNDDFGGPVVVTFCPLCRSAVVAERRVAGAVTTFGVSGRLWTPDEVDFQQSVADGRVDGLTSGGESVDPVFSRALVMYDVATRSYWSQLLATAICGPATGEVLSIRPSTLTTWGEWRAAHPDTEVLLPPGEDDVLHPGANEGYAPAETPTPDSAGPTTSGDSR